MRDSALMGGGGEAQILRIGVALIRAQEECRGKVNGVVLMGDRLFERIGDNSWGPCNFQRPKRGGSGKAKWGLR